MEKISRRKSGEIMQINKITVHCNSKTKEECSKCDLKGCKIKIK
jgi:hypothetical protein